ncbi:protein kinase [Bacillus sp. PK3_68]|nr:protein kinase [Bacillus sp. PK3_68]
MKIHRREESFDLRAIRKLYQFFADKPMKRGTVLHDRYKIFRVIGTGSYGIVYLCHDLKTHDNKVIKQLRPSKRHSKKDIELFENEVSVLRLLNHRSIPTLFEAFTHDNYLFYAMNLIDGDNLEDQIFLNKKTFNEKESLLLLSRLLGLIDYLHQNNIYHQDLRIPNILLNKQELFLIDFGLSKHGAAADSLQTSFNSSFNKQELQQQDYYDLGEILLYLLYTTYSAKNKKALPWTEELSLEPETVYLLKRLLRIEEPYSNTSEISTDLCAALKAEGNAT